MSAWASEITALRPLILEVGAYVRAARAGARVSSKAGNEPVTEADREANHRLVTGIRAVFPADAIMGEESFVDDGSWVGAPRIWFVDPIDGTREYIDGREDYSVMVGLALEGRAALGFVYQAARDRLYWGGPATGSFLAVGEESRPLVVGESIPVASMTATVSRSHVPPDLEQCLDLLGIDRVVHKGSVGVKVSLVTAGEADVYLHLDKGTKAWDLCAPEALLVGAGGRFTDAFGRPFDYRSREVANYRGIVASRCAHDEILERIGPVTARFPVRSDPVRSGS